MPTARPAISSLALALAAAGCASLPDMDSIGTALKATPSEIAATPLVVEPACLVASLVATCDFGEPDAGVLLLGGEAGGPVPAPAFDTTGGVSSLTLRVMNWNVEGLPPPLAFGRADALEQIGDALGAMRARGEAPHIVLVQEGFIPGAMRELIERSGYAYAAYGPSAYDSRPDQADALGDPWLLRGEGVGAMLGAGLYILSDFPLEDVLVQSFGACAGIDCLSNKGAMLARVRIPGAPAPLTVLNTHLNSQNSTHTPKSRAHLAHQGQIDALQEFVRANAPAGRAMIFGGDFNMGESPERWSYAVAGPRQDGETLAFARSWCGRAGAACDLSALPSHADDPRMTQDQQGFHDGALIRIRPERIALLHDAGTAEALSDHGAYLVEYRLDWGAAPPADAGPPERISLFLSSLAPGAAPERPRQD